MTGEERGSLKSDTPWAREFVIKLAGTVVCSRGEKGLLRDWPRAGMSQGRKQLELL